MCFERWHKAGPAIDDGDLLLGLAQSDWQPRGLMKGKNRFGLAVWEPVEAVHHSLFFNYSTFTVRLKNDCFYQPEGIHPLLPDRRKIYSSEPIEALF